MPDPQQKIDFLVHLGAGRCSELEQYQALHSKKILLVEADPALSEGLQARTADSTNVKVVCAAVAATTGHAMLHRYNLPGSASLHEATGLKKLFPGLKPLGPLEVETIRPEVVLEGLPLTDHQHNILVVDLPGEEFPILRALEETGLLSRFPRLFLNCGREPLYQGQSTAQNILDWLQDHGFDVVEVNDRQDPERPCWSLRQNPLRLENLNLKIKVAEFTKTSDEQAAAIEKLTKERDDHAHWHEEHAKWAKSLQAEKQTLEKQLDELTQLLSTHEKSATESAQKIQELTEVCQEQTQLLSEREVALVSVTAAHGAAETVVSEQAEIISSLQDRIGQTARENDELAAAIEKLTKERDDHAHWHEEYAKWAKALEAEKLELEKKVLALEQATKSTEQREAKLDDDLDALTRIIEEKDFRQRLMDEELIKVEGQIELIKDILIREKAF